MRTLKITHAEIEIIKIALQYIYDKKMDMLKQNSGIMSFDEKDAVLHQANKYFKVQNIFDGDRDI